ncbi:MAG: FHA domain-containing protein [Chloroflexi bacterium]|nr:FHA domain-containing protein [Chloroflexota bacterium]
MFSRRITLTITGNSHTQTVQLELTNRAVIGRSVESGDARPDVDLTPFGGAESGVSRVHAALVLDGDHVSIEDLDSTSGTRLNGLLLPPHEPYRLRSQDELELGQVRVTVRF